MHAGAYSITAGMRQADRARTLAAFFEPAQTAGTDDCRESTAGFLASNEIDQGSNPSPAIEAFNWVYNQWPRRSMIDVILKRFENPDETRILTKGRFEIVRIGGMTIGRATYEPGWK